MSSKWSRVSCVGNEPPRPDSLTYPEVSRYVNRSIHARPGSVLPAIQTPPSNAAIRSTDAAKTHADILAVRRIRRPDPVRCKSRRRRPPSPAEREGERRYFDQWVCNIARASAEWERQRQIESVRWA